MATHSRILAQKFPWMEEPGRLRTVVFQRAQHYFPFTFTILTKQQTQLKNSKPIIFAASICSFPNESCVYLKQKENQPCLFQIQVQGYPVIKVKFLEDWWVMTTLPFDPRPRLSQSCLNLCLHLLHPQTNPQSGRGGRTQLRENFTCKQISSSIYIIFQTN